MYTPEEKELQRRIIYILNNKVMEHSNELELEKETIDIKKEVPENKKLPDVTIDEYMKNFNENQFEEIEINSLFNEEEIFPNIPM